MNQFVKKGEAAHLLCEFEALKTLSTIDGINVPKNVYLSEDGKCLIMRRYNGRSTAKSQELLGGMLGKLHLHPVDGYGWTEDNYIGALPQNNAMLNDWDVFWVKRRLLPQLHSAVSVSSVFDKYLDEGRWLGIAGNIIEHRRASMIHGDLWNGNVVFDDHGSPVLIDPSIYVGVGHVDLAMTRLFGGFGPSFYEAYYTYTGFPKITTDEMHLYQLYYLLVHVNMFGPSYEGSTVKTINQIYELK